MELVDEFDDRLLENGVEDAGPWIEEWCETHPWDQHGRACRAFSHALQGRPGAMEKAEEVLGLSPFNEWALAAKFHLLHPDTTNGDERFFTREGFRLGPEWVSRFWILGDEICAFWVYSGILLHGNDDQIEMVLTYFDDLLEHFEGLVDGGLAEEEKKETQDAGSQ